MAILQDLQPATNGGYHLGSTSTRWGDLWCTGTVTASVISGIHYWSIAEKSAAYTLTSIDDIILASASGAGFTLTLPSYVNVAGKIFEIKKIDSTANTVTIDADGSETIDGNLNIPLFTQYDSLTLTAGSAGWWIV